MFTTTSYTHTKLYNERENEENKKKTKQRQQQQTLNNETSIRKH